MTQAWTHAWVSFVSRIGSKGFRWLIVFLYTAGCSTYSITTLVTLQTARAFRVNAWDAYILYLSNERFFFLATVAVWLMLVHDMAVVDPFEQIVLARSIRRERWWSGRVLGIGLASLLFVLVLAGGGALASYVSFGLDAPRDPQSLATLYQPISSETMAAQGNPEWIALGLTGIMWLTLWLIGVVAALAALVFRSGSAAFLSGLLVDVVGLVVHASESSGSGVLRWADYGRQIFLVSQLSGIRVERPVFGSMMIEALMYWTGGLILVSLAGVVAIVRQDYSAQASVGCGVSTMIDEVRELARRLLAVATVTLATVKARIAWVLIAGLVVAAITQIWLRTLAMPNTLSIGEGVLIALSGPFGDGLNLTPNTLIWLAIHVVFFFVSGDVAQRQLDELGPAAVTRAGGRLKWWGGQLLAQLLLALAYTTLMIGFAIVGAWASGTRWNWSVGQGLALISVPWNVPPNMTIAYVFGHMLILVWTTLAAVGAAQLVVATMTRRSTVGFLFSNSVLALSWVTVAMVPVAVFWLPGAQSMVIRHRPYAGSEGPTLLWTLLVNTSVLGLGWLLGALFMRSLDLFRPAQDY